MPPSLLIVDGNNLFYRAFYALPRLTAPDGTPTGAVFGFARMLAKVIDSFSPTHVAVVFDAPGRTFRDEMFEAYKETRQKMPEEMSLQLPLVKELVRRAGLALLEVEGVEADDVIATLATRGKEEGLSVIIVSSDKDLCQLVGDGVVLFDSLKDRVIDADYVREKYGVPPERIVDLIALAGDQSDNIPGVPGIGDKTAASLLREYGSLDGLLKNAEFIKGKRGQLIRDHVEEISLSRDLARVRRDLDLPVDLKDLSPAEKDAAGLREMFRKLGFTVPLFGISPRERGEEEGGAQEVKVRPVTSARDLESFLDEAGEQ
ncbi:MAG: DNA polymerase I, partial [Deltaproteobacteria bacterium]